MNLNSVFDLVSQHNGLFSGYIVYIVRCDCHTATHLKHLKLPNYLISHHRLITEQSTNKYLISLSTGAVFATCN